METDNPSLNLANGGLLMTNGTNPDGRKKELVKAGAFTVIGGAVGGVIIAVIGFAAAGTAGVDSGITAVAVPGGIATGAVVGLAAYGLYRAWKRT